MRRRSLFPVALGAVAVVALVAAIAVAVASGAGLSTKVKVTSAEPTGACTSAGRAYVVHTLVTVKNGKSRAATVAGADFSARGNSKSSHKFRADATATSDGGLEGSTLGKHAKRTYSADVMTTVPCDASKAEICVQLSTLNGSKTAKAGRKCTVFIKHGSAVVPGGTIGVLGLTLLLGAALVVGQGLSRRRSRTLGAA